MMWLDKEYALDVSLILDKLHQEATRKAIDDAVKPKDDKIDELLESNKQIRLEMQELLGYARDTKDTLDDVKNELDETKEDVAVAISYLEEKSKTSTMNPQLDSLHHHFAATQFVNKNKVTIVKFTTGTKSYVDKTIKDYVTSRNHEIVITPFYNANGFDLRQNCKTEFVKARKQRLFEINKRNKEADRKFNKKLDLEIRKYNKAHPDNKRNYFDEKHSSKVLTASSISVKFKLLSFEYVNNPYMAFNEVLQIVIETNRITQENPLSDDE